jgi:hypothetical protein
VPTEYDQTETGKARSLQGGAAASNRRTIAGVATTTSAPTTSSDGFATKHARFLHYLVKLTGGTSITYKVWHYLAAADVWVLDTRFGSSGTVTLTTAASDNPQWSIVEVAGVDRTFVQIVTNTGPATVDGWILGSTF